MRVDRLQSIRTKIITIDEWLSCDVRDNVLQAARQSCAKTPDSLIVAISSEGTVRNAIGDDIKMDLLKVLHGDIQAPYRRIWYYKLDSEKEVGHPELWIKANPNLGATVTYETYQRDVEIAEKSPSARNDILAKRFNLPMEGFTYFFTYEETLRHMPKSYWKMSCSMGCDLSLGDDFCAFTFLFPLGNGAFGVKTRDYISQLTFDRLSPAMSVKYMEFINEGSLMVMPGTVLDMMTVYADLDNFIVEQEYTVECVGYDPYNAKDFVARWESENGPFGIEKVIQGAKTESVPLGELKKLAGERMLLFDESLMEFAMGNCMVSVDTNGNRKLIKKRADQKIDAVAALMDAYVAYKLNRDAFE
jgi:phage terminase large subunit-like protein